MRLQDLSIMTNTPLDTNQVLFERFKGHDRVVHDPKTDLYSYRVRLTCNSPIHAYLHFLHPARLPIPQQSSALNRDTATHTERRRALCAHATGLVEGRASGK